jgi:hypothetical protein
VLCVTIVVCEECAREMLAKHGVCSCCQQVPVYLTRVRIGSKECTLGDARLNGFKVMC